VDGVIGVRALVVGSLKKMPPLLRGASAETVEAIGTLDSRLLVVLSATRILAEEVWQTLEQREVAG
jgi:chemotaxis signal transduction protein